MENRLNWYQRTTIHMKSENTTVLDTKTGKRPVSYVRPQTETKS